MSACLQCHDDNRSIMARGLCNKCYTRTQYQVARGKTTWDALKAMGKATDPFVRFERLSAVIRQKPKEITKLGSDNAPWHVNWRDAQGQQRDNVCVAGPDCLKAAGELQRKIA